MHVTRVSDPVTQTASVRRSVHLTLHVSRVTTALSSLTALRGRHPRGALITYHVARDLTGVSTTRWAVHDVPVPPRRVCLGLSALSPLAVRLRMGVYHPLPLYRVRTGNTLSSSLARCPPQIAAASYRSARHFLLRPS